MRHYHAAATRPAQDQYTPAEDQEAYVRAEGRVARAMPAMPIAVIRFITALVLVGALVFLGLDAYTTIRDAPATLGQAPSAVQVIQVYVEGAFKAVVAIGIGIAAYIGTRAFD